MKILLLFLVYLSVDSIPVNKTVDNAIDTTGSNKEKSEYDEADPTHTDVTEKYLENGESRAGVIDKINPFNKESQQQTETDKNDAGQTNNPLAAIQSFFGNVPQLFNGTNPFGQLFSSQPGANFLDNIKIFFVGTQGIVMPASAILGGFQNLFQTLGNLGNLIQNLPTPVPLGK